MSGPLEGIKVVELGLWVAGPSCSMILRDWGADVIKLEPPNGDPFRGLFASALGVAGPLNPPFEVDNRGKRSVAVNMEHEDGRAIAHKLVSEADVFVTNMRPRVLDDFGLDYDSLAKENERLVYAQITGYGPDGPSRDTAAYDIGAFWSRAGVGRTLTPPEEPIPQQRGGMGDHITGMGAAGAVSAALFNRERTGKGQRVAVSLLRMGVYVMGWDMSLSMRLGVPVNGYDRFHAPNPIINSFKSKDERWFWLLLLQADRHWPDLLRAIEKEDLLKDERFADIAVRRDHAAELIDELDAIFATKTLDEWGEIFDRENVWFAPVNSIADVLTDPVAQEAGAFQEVEGPEGPVKFVASPADFSATKVGPQGLAPELGQHTEEVLLELGYDWEEIIPLKEKGAIP